MKRFSILVGSFTDMLISFLMLQFIFAEFELVDEFMLIVSYSIFLLALTIHTDKDLSNFDIKTYADLRLNKVHYLVEFFIVRDNYLTFFKLIKKLPQFWQHNSELVQHFFGEVLPLTTAAVQTFETKAKKQKAYENFTK